MAQGDFDFEAYTRDFFAGLDGGEELAATLIEKGKANPNWVANGPKRFGMRESDYSRRMNELKREKEEADAKAQAALDYHQKLTAWQQQKEAEYAAGGGPRAAASAQPQPNAGGGNMQPGYVPVDKVQDLIDAQIASLREEFSKELESRGDAVYGVINDINDCAVDYVERFGRRMDRKALETFAIENKLPVGTAYKLWIQPDVETRTKEEHERKLKEAEDAGYRRALSERDSSTFTGDASPIPSRYRVSDVPEGIDPRKAAEDRYVDDYNKTQNWTNPAGLAAK